MAKTAKTKNKSQKSSTPDMKQFVKRYCNLDYATKLLTDPHYIAPICWLLLFIELILNVLIIERVNYTEIDWRAYMQEVEGFLNGSLNYEELKGDTGPCVYPAGFLYVYTALYYVTSYGTNIYLAQYIFLVFYMLQLYLTYEIYKKTCKIPGYALILSGITSYRIHSIYILRLFNDPVAVLLFYFSLNLFLTNRWKLGSLLYSLSVGVKMNTLLYAPCLLLAYLINLGIKETFVNLTICAVTQLILGAPFLYGNFQAYLKASFDLGRIFEHKWTVNYRFLSREIFENPYFHVTLLVVHVLLLLIFLPYFKRYLKSYATLRDAIVDMREQSAAEQKQKKKKQPKVAVKADVEEEPLSKEQQEFLESFEKSMRKGEAKKRGGDSKKRKSAPPQICPKQEDVEEKYSINFNKISQLMVLPFFVTNLIGVICARSLHYQFYSWYFHSLLYLVHCTTFKKPIMFLLLGVIEYCWNVYPSTDASSILLHASHACLLFGVYKTMRA